MMMKNDNEKDKNAKAENQKEYGEDQKTEKAITVKEADYQKLVQEAGDYKDKYLRLCAEFDNARKRMEREKFEFVKYANEALLADFLNILDDLERSVEAAKANHQDYAAFLKGVEMVMAHIYDMLKKNNVKPIEAKGKKFDPHVHEAMMQVESEEHEDDDIVEEFQKGYMIGDRVVRTSKVKVARAKCATDNNEMQSNNTED